MIKNYCPYCMMPVPEGESCSVCRLTSGSYIPSPHHLPPGTILMDRYLVGRVLGEGGFGITYIGRDLRLELKVAIKEYYPVDRATRNASASLEVTNFIGPSAKSFERGKRKFLDEAQVMARMDKQQVIVSVRDFFEINNTAYIVMEYVEGITFRELVKKKGGKIRPEELFPMLEPLFEALSIMHKNGLIHRDISPDNLMLEDGRVRLLDFGCAREASRGTETMTIALKHGYAPIEQYQQKGQGPWTDLYALSATIYYCLTGKVPPQALDRIAEDELLIPSKLGVELSVEQEKALLKGMRLQPNRRYASAQEMWSALYVNPEAAGPASSGQDHGSAAKVMDAAQEPEGQREDMDTAREAMEQEVVSGNDVQEAEMQTEQPGDGGAEVSSLPEIQEVTVWQRILARKRILLPAGIGAVFLIVVLAALVHGIGRNSQSQKEQDAMVEGEAESSKDREIAAEGDVDGPDTVDVSIFADAYRYGGDSQEEFQALMEDDSIGAVILESQRIELPVVTLTKPVLLAEGAYAQTDALTVTGEGSLLVEGTLNVVGSGFVRLSGKSVRLLVAENGTLLAEGAFFWMDQEECLVYDGELTGRKLVFSDEIFEGEEVISVTDEESLKKEVDAGKPIRIDADITVPEEGIGFDVPVLIPEGVTVYAAQKSESHFLLSGKGILVNEGTLNGSLNAYGEAVVINRGSYESSAFENGNVASLWIDDESLVVNEGTMVSDDVSRFFKNSYCYNLGDIYAYDLYMAGGHMLNYGNIIVPESGSRYQIVNGSQMINHDGASLTVAEGGELINGGRMVNFGEIYVEKGGIFFSAILENYRLFRAEYGAEINPQSEGIYCGSGEYDIGSADVNLFYTKNYEPQAQEGLVEASSPEELIQALEDPKAAAVFVKGNLTVGQDLIFRKNVFVDKECSLVLAEGAELHGYGSVIALMEGASFAGHSISLLEGSQIFLGENATLTVEQGSLALDDSLLWAQNGGSRICLTGANLALKNRSGFGVSPVASLEADEATVTLQNGSVLVMPDGWEQEGKLQGTTITLADEGAHSNVYFLWDAILTDCNLDVEAGVLRSWAANLTLKNCAVTVGQEGELQSELSNLSLYSGTTWENWGKSSVGGWDEYALVVHGRITNYGRLDIFLNNVELSEPIDNQGELYQ